MNGSPLRRWASTATDTFAICMSERVPSCMLRGVICWWREVVHVVLTPRLTEHRPCSIRR